MTIAVDVGEHHASPPLPHCGNSPRWIIWDDCGTGRSVVAVIVVTLVGIERVANGAATALTAYKVGVERLPFGRWTHPWFVVAPDEAVAEPLSLPGRGRRPMVVVIPRSRLVGVLRDGIPGMERGSFEKVFELRSTLQNGIRFVED